MNVLSLILACCVTGGDLPQDSQDAAATEGGILRSATQLFHQASATLTGGEDVPSVGEALTPTPIHPGCGCTYCQGAGIFGGATGGSPYVRCASCRRDGTMWPYDYRRSFDYPWDGPNYAWGSPFVAHAWWPDVLAMFGPDYPLDQVSGYGQPYGQAGVPVYGNGTLGPNGTIENVPTDVLGLLPIASPPFPTPAERKIIRID